MILFKDIYDKAIGLFNDPDITESYKQNKIIYCKLMYSYLMNCNVNHPKKIGFMLSDVEEPKGELEIFDSDGKTNAFNITLAIPENSYINYYEDGNRVVGNYNENTVTFPHVLEIGKEYAIEYYYPGAFNQNVGSIVSDSNAQKSIILKVENILARQLLCNWAESKENDLLDIQNSLTDSDFKLTPIHAILSSKVKWVKELKTQVQSEENKLDWIVRYADRS